jgi:hypothetical protein
MDLCEDLKKEMRNILESNDSDKSILCGNHNWHVPFSGNFFIAAP